MKLLDLLKSLNTGNAIDPDAQTAYATTPQRAQLLDELAGILTLLDTPGAEPEQPRSDLPGNSDSAPTNARAPLLNLAAIFAEEDFEAENLETDSAADNDQPLLFMPAENAAPSAPEERRQLVQTLLDELLPALEKALDDRLNQLDHHTLQQLEQAFTHKTR
jgi:hypothetical protein